MTEDLLTLDGRALAIGDVVEASGRAVRVAIDDAALERMRDVAEAAERISAQRPIYGRTTGVGAGRDRPVETERGGEHGLALLRSHAAGWGPSMDAGAVRAGLFVRANQLLAGGSGASADIARALVDLVNAPDDELPVITRDGSLGTGDLAALAQVGLTVVGERPSVGGERRTWSEITASDALPLMSSSAFTLGRAAIAVSALRQLAAASTSVSALGWLALRGNIEAIDPLVEEITPFAGAVEVVRTLRALLAPQLIEPVQVQDAFALRAWPQVHGPVLGAVDAAALTVDQLLNVAAENPRFVASGDERAVHHGGFHLAQLALAIDTTLLALTRSARASANRVHHVLTDTVATGLPRFLAGDTAASSGLLIAEYLAESTFATVRACASSPASLQTASCSDGVEDDASFAPLAVSQLEAALTAYRELLAVELLCSVRALRMQGVAVVSPLDAALSACDGMSVSVGGDDQDPTEELVLARVALTLLGSRQSGRT